MKENFRIIAIKPFKRCKESVLKVLNPDTFYYFYNDVEIKDNGDKIIRNENVKNYYSDGNTIINVSAIVGKNGSGKSSIIELLFRVINNLSSHYNKFNTDLKYINGIYAELYVFTDRFYKICIENNDVSIYKYKSNGSIIYEPVDDFDFKGFFYSIVVNYSLYAYNQLEYDDGVNWLDGLFHKNDGYQTPLVLSPMRTNGGIDINNENHLVRARVISNLVTPIKNKNFSFKRLTPKIEVTSLSLKLLDSIEDKELYSLKIGRSTQRVTLKKCNIKRDSVFKELNKIFKFNYTTIDKIKNKVVLDYILYKLISIAIKYEDYKVYFNRNESAFDVELIEEYFKQLFADDSHVTFKLKQTINLLKFKHISLVSQKLDLKEFEEVIEQILSKRLKNKVNRIELLPPPIFETRINLRDVKDEKSKFQFNTISSGERQLIYSVSSILYHLVNIASISNTRKRIAYKYVNVVLEEIELYFHPEQQRTFIKYILDSIKELELPRIKGINLCFITHSPFILSDIPSTNILFLQENGEPVVKEKILNTFASNIHSLLANSFFMSNGVIGAHAKNIIEDLISYLKENKFENKFDIDSAYSLINSVSDVIIKSRLMDLYYSKFKETREVKVLRKLELKKELEKLIIELGDD